MSARRRQKTEEKKEREKRMKTRRRRFKGTERQRERRDLGEKGKVRYWAKEEAEAMAEWRREGRKNRGLFEGWGSQSKGKGRSGTVEKQCKNDVED